MTDEKHLFNNTVGFVTLKFAQVYSMYNYQCPDLASKEVHTTKPKIRLLTL